MKELIIELINELPQSGKVLVALFLGALEYSIFKPFFGTDYFEYQPIINTVVMIAVGTIIGTVIYYLIQSIFKND